MNYKKTRTIFAAFVVASSIAGNNLADAQSNETPPKLTLLEMKSVAEKLSSENPLANGVRLNPDTQTLTLVFPLRANPATSSPERVVTQPTIDTSKVPVGFTVQADFADSKNSAAEGGSLITGNGCIAGFRFNGTYLSTTGHCANSWGTANGSALTHAAQYCESDFQIATGSTQNTLLGVAVNSYGDPAFEDYIHHYGVTTGWSSGVVKDWYWSAPNSVSNPGECSDAGIWLMRVEGGGMRSSGGDSGGGYVVFNGSDYTARGTHKGSLNYPDGHQDGLMIPISALYHLGFYVG
jgi:hypothetical protein